VGARKESYHFESRNPVVENGSLQDDQDRRFYYKCFSHFANAGNYGDLLDPFDGLKDIEKRF
jgi:tRNA nucleotidyltransferase (CCA-adding enzyme)